MKLRGFCEVCGMLTYIGLVLSTMVVHVQMEVMIIMKRKKFQTKES